MCARLCSCTCRRARAFSYMWNQVAFEILGRKRLGRVGCMWMFAVLLSKVHVFYTRAWVRTGLYLFPEFRIFASFCRSFLSWLKTLVEELFSRSVRYYSTIMWKMWRLYFSGFPVSTSLPHMSISRYYYHNYTNNVKTVLQRFPGINFITKHVNKLLFSSFYNVHSTWKVL